MISKHHALHKSRQDSRLRRHRLGLAAFLLWYFAGNVNFLFALTVLRPEWSALAMSASTVTVTINALLLNRVRFGEAVSKSAPNALTQT